MKYLWLAVLLIGNSVLASTNGYDLKMDLTLNGKHVSSPRVLVKEGNVATVTQKTEYGENFIDVIATEGTIQDHRGILMKFTVGRIDENGNKIIVSKPQVLTQENKAAQITVNNDNTDPHSEQLSLSVIAQRKSL